jgi:putative aldouronate transport system permease protein
MVTNSTAIKKKSARLGAVSVPAEILFHIILGGFGVLCFVPFIFTIIISFTSEKSIAVNGFSFVPAEWSVSAYKYLFERAAQVGYSTVSSLISTSVGTAASVLICVLYAYAMFRKDYKFRKFITFFSFFTMMFGGGLTATYMVSKNLLGMYNNYWALIVPLLVNPFNFIIMRTFFQSSVPDALIESAFIDGSGEYRTLFQIVLPISLPGIATIALFNMIAYWNEWFIGMLYIDKSKLMPLQLLLVKMQQEAEFVSKNSGKLGSIATQIGPVPTESLRMALVAIIVIPIAFAYPFFQRYIISGLTIGAVKG